MKTKRQFCREKHIAGVGWKAEKRCRTYWFVKMSDGWSVWGPVNENEPLGPNFIGSGFKSRKEAYDAIN